MNRRVVVVMMMVLSILLLSGCGNGNDVKEPEVLGTTETFSRGEFMVEVSNVSAVRTEEALAEGIQPYERTIFTCYPGAVMTIVNADMTDPIYYEDNKPHPQWGLYDEENDQRTRLTDDMEPIPLNDKTDCVYHLESSVGVLFFEFVEE